MNSITSFKWNPEIGTPLVNSTFDFVDLDHFSPGKTLNLSVAHGDGSTDTIECNHTYNEAQISWFKAGSALNLIRSEQS